MGPEVISITIDEYKGQRYHRFGQSVAERMKVPLWEWAVRTGSTPYGIRKRLWIPDDVVNYSGYEIGPLGRNQREWTFERFGPSRTRLPDGRVIWIAGEHEDWYDRCFCIYNDVIVMHPPTGRQHVNETEGRVEIYGYPEDVLRPMDHHSATLIGDRILIIGGNGYGDTKKYDQTECEWLSIRDYGVERLVCSGESPGLIIKHYSRYDPATHSVLVRGGERYVRDAQGKWDCVENVDIYRLHLGSCTWECIGRDEQRSSWKIEPIEEDLERMDCPQHPYFISEVIQSKNIAEFVDAYPQDMEFCSWLDVEGVQVVVTFRWLFGLEVDFIGTVSLDRQMQVLRYLQTEIEAFLNCRSEVAQHTKEMS